MTITVNPNTGVSVQATLDTDTAPGGERQVVVPAMLNAGHLLAQTANPGTGYTAFASQACKQLTISNQSGVTILVQQGGAGVGFQIPHGGVVPFYGLTNANQLAVKRQDDSNTQVTVTARWEA